MTSFIDLTGQKFGRWYVIDFAGRTEKGVSMWNCICDCGTKRPVRSNGLIGGTSKSCGCLAYELSAERGRNRKGKALPNTALADGALNVVFGVYTASAKAHNHEFTITKEEFKNLTSQTCYYCGAEPHLTQRTKYSEYTYNGLDRINSKKDYTIDNVVPCCFQCNRSKGEKSVEEFLNWVEKIYNYQHKETK